MDFKNFAITKFVSCFYATDKKGRKKEFEKRRFACFILTLKGRISFTAGDVRVFSDSKHAVFLPQGLNYINECLEDAESIVLNFLTSEPYTQPASLVAVSNARAIECYNTIKKASVSLFARRRMIVYSEIYSIAAELFSERSENRMSDTIARQAVEYMMENYHDNTLTVKDVANSCYISEIYLRKLFEKKYSTTPFKKLTEIRMKRAYVLAKEKRPITEIAEAVGYGAVCQFSRAYKKYYGRSPSEE
ncbi:MAG: helix-turn-helix transcriptional regulator [Ruminococcaceae bacterium]|nr:helix-turn-helix transcriptional regulator [Oscillospiraceae bacterium]